MKLTLDAARRVYRRARALPSTELFRRVGGRVDRLARRKLRKYRALLRPRTFTEPEFRALFGWTGADHALAESLLRAAGERFFFGWEDRGALLGRLAARSPESAERTRRAAEALLLHRFDLLGSGPTDLGPEIDWHRDFKSGRAWPRRHYTEIVPVDLTDASDVKVPRELSRGHHLLRLGQAAWWAFEEGDPVRGARYVEEVRAQLAHWVRENPVEWGVNWECPMDVAIRAVNWTLALGLVGRAPGVPPASWLPVLGSLFWHGRYLRENLEWNPVQRNNHYLADLVGLLYLGVLFHDTAEGRAWAELALGELRAELPLQVFADGVSQESATGYHRLVTELYLSATALALLNAARLGLGLPGGPRPPRGRAPVSAVLGPDNAEILGNMLEFVRYYTRPDGTAPALGDGDDGALHPLGPANPRDHREVLAVGAGLLERDDLGPLGGEPHEAAVWLLFRWGYGAEPVPGEAVPPAEPGSRAFPVGGVYIMRGRGAGALVSLGVVGLGGYGGHRHNDTLSFEWWAGGRRILVDPGTYTYSADPRWRNWFRSSAAHNTVTVDGEEINVLDPEALFALGRDADPRALAWEDTEAMSRLDAEHVGYRRLPAPVTHRRRLELDKRTGTVSVRDRLTGPGRHHVAWSFHFDVGLAVRAEADGTVRVAGPEGLTAWLVPEPDHGLELEVRPGWVSPRYGVKEPAPVAIYTAADAPLPLERRFQLAAGTRAPSESGR